MTVEQQAIGKALECIEALEEMDLPGLPLNWTSRHVEMVVYTLDKIRALLESVAEDR